MKKFKLTLCLVIVTVILAGCVSNAPQATANITATVQATPIVTRENAETAAPSPTESEEIAVEENTDIEYFEIDYSNIEQLKSYTPEFVLDGFYDAFIQCVPYIKEIEINYYLYSYGEISCLVEGISIAELRNIIEKSFGITMRKNDFGYFSEIEEGTYDLNKVVIEAMDDMFFLKMQNTDFSMVDSIKLPEYYINQLGENVFNISPKNSIITHQIVQFDFEENTFNFSNAYSIPNKNSQDILDDYIDMLSNIEGYSYNYNEEWNQHFYNIKKSDEITIVNKKNDYGDSLEIYSTVQYKKPLLLDSQTFEQTHSLEFEDLYNYLALEITPILDGEIIAASIAENQEFTPYAIIDLMEFADVLGDAADVAVKDAVITNLFYGGYYDCDQQMDEIVPVDDIINAVGGTLIHSDKYNLVMYKENEYFLHARVEENIDNWIGEEPYLAYTLVDIGSSEYGSIEQLKLIDQIPALNVDANNESLNIRLELKKENEQYLFRFVKFYIIEANTFDEINDMYEKYIMNQTSEYNTWAGNGARNWEYLIDSEVYTDIAYITQAFVGMPGDDAVFVNVSVGEFAKDWED